MAGDLDFQRELLGEERGVWAAGRAGGWREEIVGGRDLAAAAAGEIKGNQSTSTKERNGMEARGDRRV